MSETTAGSPPVAWPDVPRSAWLLGWSFVLGQVIELVRRGTQQDNVWPVSVVLSVALVVFFSHGVVRARLVRFWIVVVILSLGAAVSVVGLVAEPSPGGMLGLALALVQLTLLHDLYRSEWFALQRQGVAGAPSLVPIMLVAVLVGVLGGVLGADSSGMNVTFNGSI